MGVGRLSQTWWAKRARGKRYLGMVSRSACDSGGPGDCKARRGRVFAEGTCREVWLGAVWNQGFDDAANCSGVEGGAAFCRGNRKTAEDRSWRRQREAGWVVLDMN